MHSKSDLEKQGIKGTYAGSQFYNVDEKTNLMMNYDNDGKIKAVMPLMNEVVSEGKDKSGGSNAIKTFNTIVVTTGASEEVIEGILKLDKGVKTAVPILSSALKEPGNYWDIPQL